MKEKLEITSPSFVDGGAIPKKHTGFGEDISPAFILDGLSDSAVSIVIVMDDLDIPFVPEYNHWIIWNIPASSSIPENIPRGEKVNSLGNAVQGTAYGKNRYRGPKQPVFIRNMHRYRFRFYVSDCIIKLDGSARKSDLLNALNGHIIQTGEITGTYKR